MGLLRQEREAREGLQVHSRQGERWEQRPGRKEPFRNLYITITKKAPFHTLVFFAELLQKWDMVASQ